MTEATRSGVFKKDILKKTERLSMKDFKVAGFPLPLYVLILALTALGGGGLAAAALLALWRYYFVAKKQFGGITGDLAGWFLQRAELWMLAALAVSQWGGVL